MKIILDTDIGGDFDDANALALLAGLPEVDLVAVTTVGAGGSAVARARLAAHILRLAGHGGVPVHAGLDQPLVAHPTLAALAPEMILNGYQDSMAEIPLAPRHAVEALVAYAARYGEELTLVCSGALTNVAAALQRRESAVRRIGRVVLMGGAYRTQYREANVAIDPEAAAAVFHAGLPITAIGLEEARRSSLPLSVYGEERFIASPLGAFYAAMARRYAAAYRTDAVILYDVTAATAAVHPEWFTVEERRVAVELHGTFTRGMTVVEHDRFFNAVPGATALLVAADHDAGAVLDLFSETVLRGRWPAV